jgi:hypothetical protein
MGPGGRRAGGVGGTRRGRMVRARGRVLPDPRGRSRGDSGALAQGKVGSALAPRAARGAGRGRPSRGWGAAGGGGVLADGRACHRVRAPAGPAPEGLGRADRFSMAPGCRRAGARRGTIGRAHVRALPGPQRRSGGAAAGERRAGSLSMAPGCRRAGARPGTRGGRLPRTPVLGRGSIGFPSPGPSPRPRGGDPPSAPPSTCIHGRFPCFADTPPSGAGSIPVSVTWALGGAGAARQAGSPVTDAAVPRRR